MATFLITFGILLLAIAGLAVGVLGGRAPIKGSCGDLACLKGIDCGLCKAKHRKDGA